MPNLTDRIKQPFLWFCQVWDNGWSAFNQAILKHCTLARDLDEAFQAQARGEEFDGKKWQNIMCRFAFWMLFTMFATVGTMGFFFR